MFLGAMTAAIDCYLIIIIYLDNIFVSKFNSTHLPYTALINFTLKYIKTLINSDIAHWTHITNTGQLVTGLRRSISFDYLSLGAGLPSTPPPPRSIHVIASPPSNSGTMQI